MTIRAAILTDPPDLSAYLAEMLKAWGLPLYDVVQGDELPRMDPGVVPVLVCPAGVCGSAESILDYAHRGGTVICFLPDGKLAAAAGLTLSGEKEVPLRLRITAYPAAGLAGELLPVVGNAGTYAHGAEARVLGYLSHPGRYEGESAGIVEGRTGKGRIVAFAFDLAMCVLMLRQGDPQRREFIPPGDRCARPSHLAAEIGPNDAAWIPYADLLSRLFVDMVRRHIPAPVPLLSHLPGTARGILLYSGDEDGAQVSWNEEEFDCVKAAGGRMNLYIIPIRTNSTVADVERYRRHHDVGPHPDIRPLDGRTVAERIAEFERQIRLFEEMFGLRARTLRNHSTVWPGYMEPVEAMERLGVRMDVNYTSGTYMRDRNGAPYAGFGAAVPMRFCRHDGRVLDVVQQHTHAMDDVLFKSVDYSYKLSAAQYEVILDRIFADIVTRFHVPHAVCIHPGAWVKFSRQQGQALLRKAAEREMPIWSFDQWSVFWDARDTWRIGGLKWDGSELAFALSGQESHDDLCFTLPAVFGDKVLQGVRVDGKTAAGVQEVRYGEDVTFVSVPSGKQKASVAADYVPVSSRP